MDHLEVETVSAATPGSGVGRLRMKAHAVDRDAASVPNFYRLRVLATHALARGPGLAELTADPADGARIMDADRHEGAVEPDVAERHVVGVRFPAGALLGADVDRDVA